MNSESPVFRMENMLHVRFARYDSTGCSEKVPPEIFAAGAQDTREEEISHRADLADLMNEVTLEQSQPFLLKSLTDLLQHAEPLLPEVEDALDSLKEGFLGLLRFLLAESGIDTETRLVLGLDGAGRLEVVEPLHPRAQELNALLAQTPELALAMREISRQAILLRGLQDIGNVIHEPSNGQDRSELLQILVHLVPYHVCLRGALSHFYFPRQ